MADFDGAPVPWPWDRLLVFGIGCGLSMVGTYIVIFAAFQKELGVDDNILQAPFFWGMLAIIVGIILLSTPWFKSGPLAKKWKGD